ncbi:hypothetical protein ABMA28_002052 [Loxostege sticticalis]|uniref:Amine oxidase domain-containing protein n=1 Tax=Loxostege sticticalis TaxID=481309 RepID=A0ABD0SZL1_LOXSC
MSPKLDVVVIGCGASGIAALSKLQEAGLNVLGLEALERTGGRIHTLDFAGGLVDIGAAWCNGEVNNIVYELAAPYDLLAGPGAKDEEWFIFSNGTVMPSGDAQTIRNKITEAIDKADKNNTKSISEFIRDVVKKDPIGDLVHIQSFIEWYERDNNVGGQDDPRKAKSLKGIEEKEICSGEFWLHWKGKGFQTLFDVLLKKPTYSSNPITPTILLNKPVSSINWQLEDEDGKPYVEVVCADGAKYETKAVISTVTVGVLKESHGQFFNPVLPSDKVNCINNLGYGVFDKIHIEFASTWWPKSPARFRILWKEEDKMKFSADEKWVTEIYELRTLEHPNLPKVLVAFIYGKGAEQAEYKSLDEVKAGIQKLVDQIFSLNFEVSEIKSIERTKWRKNKFARGTHSYRCVATEESGASAAALSTPLLHKGVPVVCFAGEATSHKHYNSVHGAVETGFREADRLIQTITRS